MLQYGEQVLRMVSGSNGMPGCMSVVMMLFIRASQKNTSQYFEFDILCTTKTDYAHFAGIFFVSYKRECPSCRYFLIDADDRLDLLFYTSSCQEIVCGRSLMHAYGGKWEP